MRCAPEPRRLLRSEREAYDAAYGRRSNILEIVLLASVYVVAAVVAFTGIIGDVGIAVVGSVVDIVNGKRDRLSGHEQHDRRMRWREQYRNQHAGD